jgi:hypothetical protein
MGNFCGGALKCSEQPRSRPGINTELRRPPAQRPDASLNQPRPSGENIHHHPGAESGLRQQPRTRRLMGHAGEGSAKERRIIAGKVAEVSRVSAPRK